MELLSFSERATRTDYWLIGVGLGFVQGLLLGLTFLVAPYVPADLTIPVTVVLPTLIILAFLWPLTAVGFRRSHDLGLSGLWYGTYMAVGLGLDLGSRLLLAQMSALTDRSQGVLNTVMLIDFALGILFFIAFAFLRGSSGRNRFGPSPHGRQQNYQAPAMDVQGETPATGEVNAHR